MSRQAWGQQSSPNMSALRCKEVRHALIQQMLPWSHQKDIKSEWNGGHERIGISTRDVTSLTCIRY